MPIVIPASTWNIDFSNIGNSFQENHGQKITTENLLKSMDEVFARKEIVELNKMIMSNPNQYKGKQ